MFFFTTNDLLSVGTFEIRVGGFLFFFYALTIAIQRRAFHLSRLLYNSRDAGGSGWTEISMRVDFLFSFNRRFISP